MVYATPTGTLHGLSPREWLRDKNWDVRRHSRLGRAQDIRSTQAMNELISRG